MDHTDVRSYRPVSNLSVVSKLLERIVARRLLSYLTSAGLMPSLQSAYRVNHSTETAVFRVLVNILLALDRGDFAVLVILDLSAAFDTVNHTTLLRRLKCSYGICGTALGWVRSYLTGQTQYVRSESTSSLPTVLQTGVPQGSVLGPILFLLYTADLIGLVTGHGLRSHLFADDSRAYGSCPPAATVGLQNQLSVCVGDVGKWMAANGLQLNADKTEFMWCSSQRRIGQSPSEPFVVCGNLVTLSNVVRDLCVWSDDVHSHHQDRRRVFRHSASVTQCTSVVVA